VIKALVIDDEALAREGIRTLLSHEGDVDIVGEAADGPSAVKAIRRLIPDLVFLDVQMPGFDGFEVLDRVTTDYIPAVIFVTAHDAYAVRAFESRAVDYLLKPISAARLRESVRRVRFALAQEEALETLHGRLTEFLLARRHAASVEPRHPSDRQRLVVKDGGRFVLIKTDEIDWIESAANYAEVHARGRSFFLRMTMNALEEKLDAMQFARIHRSTIVNVDRVRDIIASESHGDFDVTLEDRTVLRLSRGYRDRLLPNT
jgi:two-component system LytT family response regulator